jgi:oxygen-independent coproporphyrinogen-3 oxidase
MNRNHTAEQSKKAIENILLSDIKNFSLDLIYGLPNSDIKKWEKNITEAIKFNPEHISAYHLTYEPLTVFYKYLQKNRIIPVSESQSLEQYNLLINILSDNDFEHYEISNFAKNKKYSLHNTNYWNNKKYLGLGPSAHSFNKTSRQWNVANLTKYIEAINNRQQFFEKEILSTKDKFNDYIITSLRTKWGIKISELQNNFNSNFVKHFEKIKQKYIANNNAVCNNGIFKLTEKGFLISNKIFEDFIII